MAVLAASSFAFTGCDEDLEVPPLDVPSTDVRANMSILDFKEKYWNDEDNYYVEIPKNDNGEDIILGGRISATDEGGNIYQVVVLQDETASIAISVSLDRNNGLSNLYTKYKVGEEMYINVTGLAAGKYAGLFQIGAPEIYNGKPQTGRMPGVTFMEHTYLNGLPQPDQVRTEVMTIEELNSIRSVEDLQKYQSQRIRINNVSWIGGGVDSWGVTGTTSTATNRYLIDADGKQVLARNSNRSDFCDQILPAGHGDVIATLGYFNGTWQLMFQSPDDCIDFGGESYAPQITGDGSETDPFSVSSVLAGATGSDMWVSGYIVGWVSGQVLKDGANFTVPASSASNILMADKPDETNVSNCIPVQLTSGSDARTALNLQNNPGNLGRQVKVKGSLEAYFGAAGVKTVTAYVLGEGGVTPPEPAEGGTAEKPFTVDQILGASASGSGVWMTGYIVGAVNDKSISDAAFTAPFSLASNILVAATPGETDVTKCVPVQLVSGTDSRTALNLKDNEGNLGKQVSLKGDVATYFGVPGFKTVSAYAWGDKGTDTPDTPVTGTQFRKVTSITSGKEYLLVAEGKMAVLPTGNYGYLKVADATDNGGVITADAANAYTFTAVSGGYEIKLSSGKYVYMTGTFNSFNFSDTTPTEGGVWTVSIAADGSATITNVEKGKYIQYSTQYTSFGSYANATGTLPVLYEKVN